MYSANKVRARVALAVAVAFLAGCSAPQRAAERAALDPNDDACVKLRASDATGAEVCVWVHELRALAPVIVPLVLAGRARGDGGSEAGR